MSALGSILLNWLLLFPFMAAAAIALFPRVLRLVPEHERRSAAGAPAVAAISGITLSLIVCAAMGGIVRRGDVRADYLWTPDFFQFRLRLDGLGLYSLLGMLGALLLAALWSAWSCSVPATAAGGRDHVRWAGLAGAAGAFTGMVLAADFVLLYMFWELTALASWVALAPPYARGRRYLAWNHAAGLCLLVALLWVAALSRDTHIYTAGAGLLIQRLTAVKWLGRLMLVGLAAKLALVPLHFWLRDAARGGDAWDFALPGVGVLAAAYAAISLVFRILPNYAATALAWLPMAMGAVTAAYAGVKALTANDIRGSASYVLMAAAGQVALGVGVAMRGGAAAGAALQGAAALLAPMALAVPLLAAAASAQQANGPNDEGAASRMTALQAASAAGAAWILAGLPPLAGFWGQRALVTAAWHAGPVLGAVALIAPALMTAYAAKTIAAALAQRSPMAAAEARRAMWWTAGVILVSLILGAAPKLWVPYLGAIARALTGV